MNIVTALDVKEWVAKASESDIRDLLSEGLEDLITMLEDDDFFGTEGFNKRFA